MNEPMGRAGYPCSVHDDSATGPVSVRVTDHGGTVQIGPTGDGRWLVFEPGFRYPRRHDGRWAPDVAVLTQHGVRLLPAPTALGDRRTSRNVPDGAPDPVPGLVVLMRSA